MATSKKPKKPSVQANGADRHIGKSITTWFSKEEHAALKAEADAGFRTMGKQIRFRLFGKEEA